MCKDPEVRIGLVPLRNGKETDVAGQEYVKRRRSGQVRRKARSEYVGLCRPCKEYGFNAETGDSRRMT